MGSFMNSKFGFRMLILSALLLGACTHKQASTSQVTLQLPDFRQQKVASKAVSSFAATPSLMVIIVNVSAPDMGTVFWQWNAHSATDLPPGTVSLDVPRGSGRLIQVLGVLMDPNTQAMTFDYGDVQQDITDSTSSASVTINPIGSANGGEGAIVGRYTYIDGTGPTGVIDIKFPPPNGRPAMVVQRAESFGGWMNLFGLQTQAFNYVFEDGTLLFANSIINSTNPLVSGSPNAMLVSIPAAYRNFGGPDTELDQNRLIIAGFFGPGATGKSSCYNPSTISIPNMFVNAGLTTPLQWVGLGGSLSQAGVMSGSGGSPIASCTGTPFADYVRFQESLLANRDNLLGFTGPYLVNLTGQGSNAVTSTYSPVSQAMTLSWNYIPNATSGIDGTEVFYRTGVTVNGQPDYQINDGYACDQMASYGFSSAGKVPLGTNSVVISGINSTYISSGQFQAVLCPYRLVSKYIPFSGSAFYFHTGASYQAFGGGGQTLYQLKWMSATPAGAGVLASDNTQDSTCKAFTVQIQDMTGAAYNVPAAVNITVNNLTTYSEPTCTTAASNFSIPAGQNSVTVYANPGASGYFPLTISANQMNMATVDFAYVSAGTPLNLAVNVPNPAVAVFTCNPINYRVEASTGVPATGTTTYTFTPTTPIAGNFHLKPDCSDPALTGSVTIPAYSHGVTVYFYPTATTSSAMSVSASGVTGLSPSSTGTLNVGDQIATTVSLSILNAAGPVCEPVSFTFKDMISAPVPPPQTATSITMVTSGTGSFYSDPGCTTSPLGTTATVNFPNPQPVYFSGPGPSGGDTVNYTVTPASIAGGSAPFSW